MADGLDPLPHLEAGERAGDETCIPDACGCQRCRHDRSAATPFVFPIMVLCRECGNKRCPHATDHRNACTRSNEPGQHGSVYGDYEMPPFAAVSRIPETKDADPVPSVRGAQDAPTPDEFLTRARGFVDDYPDYYFGKDGVRLHIERLVAHVARETDRKAREDCARIADDYGEHDIASRLIQSIRS